MRKTVAAAAIAFLAGCAATPEQAANLNEETLCVRYGTSLRANQTERAAVFGADIARRGIRLSEADLTSIRSETVRIGMSTCAMFASWGHSTVDNRTTTARGVRVQHVWRGFSGQYVRTRSNFAYTENGIVVAVQN